MILEGVDGPLQAGTYSIETDEEQIPGLSFIVYRRIQTTIIVPHNTGATIAGRLW